MSNRSDAPLLFDQATLDFYDEEAPIYVASGTGGASRWLPDFMNMLPTGARILELGCGGGRDAEVLLANGFEVVPTDGVAAIAAKAEERLGRPVKVMRFDELSESRAFDAVWANASLLHVPLAGLGKIFALIHEALRPGGLFFASYKTGSSDGRDSLGRYFNYPDERALDGAYASSAIWDFVTKIEYVGGGFEGGNGPWIAITARKPLDQ